MDDPANGNIVFGVAVARRNYRQGRRDLEDALVDALVATYESVTGRKASDSLRESMRRAIQGAG